MKTLIKAERVFLEDRIAENGAVLVEGDKIGAVFENSEILPEADNVIELGNVNLTPALVDIHIHGGNGHDTMDLSYSALNEISLYEITQGVGYFCPATVTTSLQKTKAAVLEVLTATKRGTSGARILGSFLEGPYIDSKYKGAHPEEFIRKVDIREIMELIDTGDGSVNSFAIAPNLDGAMEAIRRLREKGVTVRIGHSAADGKIANEAIENGAGVMIHTFNAMSPFSHREPGMAGVSMANDDVYSEVICDLVHTSAEAVKVLYRCKSADKMVFITDSMMAGGLKDGNYVLGELPVKVTNGIARTESGALAGSTLKLNIAIKNAVETVGIPMFDAVKMATATPAKAVGKFDSIGSVSVGKMASLAAFDDRFNPVFVMVEGEVKKQSKR